MKANEAPKSKFVYPDKLYARTKDNITLDISYAPQTLEAVEYTRTATFIEKAVKFLKDRVDIPYDIKTNEKGEPYADSYIDYATKRLEAENKFIENFKNYMRQ
jgi:hypothetical protein